MVLIWLTSPWWLNPLKQHGLNASVKQTVVNGTHFSSVTSQYGGRVFFDFNFDIRDLSLASHVPKLHRDILTVWRATF